MEIDISTMASLATTTVTCLVPYLKKGGEAIAEGIGKDLWDNVKKIFKGSENENELKKLEQNYIEEDISDFKVLLKKRLENNPELAEELKAFIRNHESEFNIIISENSEITDVVQKGKNNKIDAKNSKIVRVKQG